MRLTKRIVKFASTLLLVTVAGGSSFAQDSPTPRVLPNPVLVFSGPGEHSTTGGKKFIRYSFTVENFQAYPATMFAAAPELPPCGQNTKSSRTWVDFFDQSGKRLNGFCALGNPSGLNKIWFALPEDEIPPSWVYIELTDRKTNTKYKSNLQETTQ